LDIDSKIVYIRVAPDDKNFGDELGDENRIYDEEKNMVRSRSPFFMVNELMVDEFIKELSEHAKKLCKQKKYH